VIVDGLLEVAEQVISIAEVAKHSSLCCPITKLSHQHQIFPAQKQFQPARKQIIFK